jgi:hypothetical protein
MKHLWHHPALRSWSSLPQLVLHQAAWWACVLWMGWWGPMVMLLFLIVHLVVMRAQWRQELGLIALSTALGIGLDNALAAGGAVTYVGDILVGRSPLWLVAIWAGFGATMRHSQAILVRSARIAIITGAVGGPLAYMGGEKLERMVVMGTSGWVAIGVLWTLAMTVLFFAARPGTGMKA